MTFVREMDDECNNIIPSSSYRGMLPTEIYIDTMAGKLTVDMS